MSKVVKDAWWHWGAILIVLFVLTYAGVTRLHVREFTLFMLVVLAASSALVALLVLSQQRQDQPPEPNRQRSASTHRL
jgi:hypothetical protein